jgi:hypothetical protein
MSSRRALLLASQTRFSNSSDTAYLRSPLFVRALMTSVRTAITDELLGRKPLLAQDIAADEQAEGLLCQHGPGVGAA